MVALALLLEMMQLVNVAVLRIAIPPPLRSAGPPLDRGDECLLQDVGNIDPLL